MSSPRSTVHALWSLFVLVVVAACGVVVVDVTLRGRDGTESAEAERSGAARIASWGSPPAPSRPADAPFPEVGSLARDFALPVLSTHEPWVTTDTLRLSDYRGRWVYLDVFGSWCLPCQQKYPAMDAIAREMEAQGAAVIGLLLEDRPADAAAWFEKNGGLAYPFVVLDDATAAAWGLTGAPMGFLISPDGRIERKCYGCSRGRDAVERLPEEVRKLGRP